MKKLYILLVIAIVISGIAYFYYASKNKNAKPIILCSTSLIHDATKELTGEWADVVCIMGPGIDPHLYKASSHDTYNITNAKVIFYNGLHLEGKMADIFSQIKKQGKSIYAVSDGLDKKDLIETEYKDIYDPHIWHDVLLWKQVVFYISQQLIVHFPDQKESIEKKYTAYAEQLDHLHQWVIETLSLLKNCRVLITSHDAFSYFAKRYKMLFYSVQGISTDAEATVNDTERVLSIILKHNVPTIFVEHTVSQNYLKNIQSIIQLKGKSLHIGDKLFSDALGEEDGTTYLDMIKENVLTIVHGLKHHE